MMNINGILKYEDNLYEKENTSKVILIRIKDYLGTDVDLKKHFYDIKWSE